MKENSVVFSPEAENELLEIYDWIAAAASSEVAFGYVTRIEEFCERLSIGPLRGQVRDDIRPGLRIVGFERRVAVAFKCDAGQVVILRVFYGGRNWEELIE